MQLRCMGEAVLGMLRGYGKKEEQPRIVQVVNIRFGVILPRVGRAHELIDQEGSGSVRGATEHPPPITQLQILARFRILSCGTKGSIFLNSLMAERQ